MAKFYPLRVADIRRETRDAVVVTLEAPEDARSEFTYIQGQYLTFRKTFHDEEIRRCYSICSGVNDNTLRIGVKKVDDGWFSSFANEELKVGDTLEAMPPTGNFYTPLDSSKGRNYLGFAGGSGITPLISLIKTTLEEEPKSTFTLVYGNRSANAVMFKEEIEDIKNRNMERFNVIHILEQETEIELFTGLLTEEKCKELLEHWVDVKNADLAFICGPKPMMTGVSGALTACGMAKENIKFEFFASAPRGNYSKAAAAEATNTEERCKAEIILDGVKREIDMPMRGRSVLEAALAADLEAPFSCQAGVCSTCRAKVIEGETEMRTNYALEDYEVERGYVLTCQCYPLSDKIVVDFDQ